METFYKGRALEVGETIPGTVLTFVQGILPRRGEFRCICGDVRGYNMIEIERCERKSCGCRRYARRAGL